jgi:hypothetical protein
MADDQIQVQITADTSGFEQAMQNAANAAQGSFDKIKQAAEGAGNAVDNAGTKNRTASTTGQSANKDWTKSFSNLQGAINSSITGMILGTTTWQKAVQRLSQMALTDMINLAQQQLAQWLASELGMTAATEAGAATRTASEQAASNASLTSVALKAIKMIANDALQTFAGVFAFFSPEMGPAAAAPAAASAASVSAASGAIAFAAGGMWEVPSDTLAMIHKQESILPAHIAQPMRDFFTGGGAAAGGGGGNFAITIQAIDTQTGAQFLMNNAGAIAQGLAREMRNGNSALRSALK